MKTLITLLTLLTIAPAAFAEIVVTPSAPTVSDTVTLRLQNQFGAHATVASASISQSGNTFSIVQNVNYACTSPSNPLVVSTFPIGPLPAGLYTVTATINFLNPDDPSCAVAPRTQTITFLVTGEPIPTVGTWGLWLLMFTLAGIALLKTSRASWT